MKPRLILASASPRRRQLLTEYGFTHEVCPAQIEEAETPSLTARELVLLNASRKCLAMSALRPGDVTLGVDTLVSLDGAVFGKPRDLAHARQMLGRLSGREHQVYSGVCLASGVQQVSFVEETAVCFRKLEAAGIDGYLAVIDPLDKAGAYAVQEHAEMIIASTVGSWSNIMGLPMERLTAVLAESFCVVPTR